MAGVADHLYFKCALTGVEECVGPTGSTFPCLYIEDVLTDNSCYVSGRAVVRMVNDGGAGTDGDSKWAALLCLFLIWVLYRLAVLLLLYLPLDRLKALWQECMSTGLETSVLTSRIGLHKVEGQLKYLMATNIRDGLKPASINCSVNTAAFKPYDSRNIHHNNCNIKNRNNCQYDSMLVKSYSSDIHDLLFDSSYLHMTPVLRAQEKRTACLQWKNLTAVLKKSNRAVLEGVGGLARSGRVVGVMGAPGAGKSTFLRTLCSRASYVHVTGDVMLGKRRLAPSDSVYIPPEEPLNGVMSVYEQVDFVGMMKCSDWSGMRRRSNHLLGVLGLLEKAGVACESLHAAERTRVRVAMGMIVNPNLLCLEEPTTALDTSAACSVMDYLVALAKDTEVCVIVTLRRPSAMVFDKLHDVMLLDNGRVAYFGPLQSIVRYFSSQGCQGPACDVNPAEYYVSVVNHAPVSSGPVGAVTWGDVYSASQFYVNLNKYVDELVADSLEAKPVAEAPPKGGVRLSVLMLYVTRTYCRETGLYFARVCAMVLWGLFLGSLYFQLTRETQLLTQYCGAVALSMWCALFSGVTATAAFSRHRSSIAALVQRDVFHPVMYCTAQFLASLPFQMLCSLAFQIPFLMMTNINPYSQDVLTFTAVITFGHMLLAESIMICVVEYVTDAVRSSCCSILAITLLFLFSGVFIRVKGMSFWVRWIASLTPTKVRSSCFQPPHLANISFHYVIGHMFHRDVCAPLPTLDLDLLHST